MTTSDAATVDVLRAKPTRIVLAKLVADPEHPDREVQSDQLEPYDIVMSANVLADIEDQYGSLAGWEQATAAKPFKTLRDTLATCLGLDPRHVGARMVPAEQEQYGRAVGIAFAIAHGADPTEAVAAIDAAAAEHQAQIEAEQSRPSSAPAESASNATDAG